MIRYHQMLRSETEGALEEVVRAAHTYLKANETQISWILLLTEALSRLRRHTEAVAWYKKGLKLDPDNLELQNGLKKSRVAVLNDLLESSEEEDDNVLNSFKIVDPILKIVSTKDSAESSCEMRLSEEGGMPRSLQTAQMQSHTTSEVSGNRREGTAEQDGKLITRAVIQGKFERMLEHFDMRKLARIVAVSIFLELFDVRNVAIGTGFLFLGLLAQAIIHRQKIMVITMLIICFYRSQLKMQAQSFLQKWGQTSQDKLGVFMLAPQIVFVIPILMKVFGQLKFMLFLQQDVCLAASVVFVAGTLVANALRVNAGQYAREWGEGRRLKFAAYFTALVYWVIWRGQWASTTRLLGPALIDAGGIVLGSVSSSELQDVCRRAFMRLYNYVVNDMQAHVDLDAWFILGLSNWIVEYWQQPTDISPEMLLRMLAEYFDSLEKAAVRTFSVELRHLRYQVNNRQITSELQLLIEYLKQSLNAVPPSWTFGMAVLFAKSCPSFVLFGLLVICSGVFSVPLLPFVVSEFQSARTLYGLNRTGILQEMDGFEVMLMDSPLKYVWKNLKSCVYCLEGGVTFTKAVTTGKHIVVAAANISWLVGFVSEVKQNGIFANIHEIPECIASVFTITKESSLIEDGVRFLRESTHFREFQASVINWWSKET
ncbi:hypothetical protein CCR75_009208 [Bremia lactucae]|uniref:Uncharacterized protein n=1 Tax=Bremia lactucae TaxID=4779 RepID=A0A976FEC6_BRELC|nr:hypothetical protein CCR75_009208 [Bremia lactucae]